MNICLKISTAAVTLMWTAIPTFAQTIVDLGLLPGGQYLSATAVSGDGATVVGIGDSNPNNLPPPRHDLGFRWTTGLGLQMLPLPQGDLGCIVTAVNYDGTVIVGYSTDPDSMSHGLRWTVTAGGVSVAKLQEGTSVFGVNHDGTVMVGECYTPYDAHTVFDFASEWLQSLSTQPLLGTIPDSFYYLNPYFGTHSDVISYSSLNYFPLRALGVSGSGSVIVGTGYQTFPDQLGRLFVDGFGSSASFAWTSPGIVNVISQPPSSFWSSKASAVSADGSTVVGNDVGPNTGQGYIWKRATGVRMGIAYSAGADPKAANADGSVIVGNSIFYAAPFIWTEQDGARSLQVYLPSVGTDLTPFPFPLISATGISADGKIIVGHGRCSNCQPRAYRVSLVCSPTSHRACPADFDCSGALAVADIFTFLNAWFAGSPTADFDGANGLQVADIFAFLNAWFAGC